MRLFLGLLCITAASCSVDSDRANQQVTLEYNQQQIRNTVAKAGQTARNVASSVGNVAAATGGAIKNEVGSVNVKVDVNRTPTEKTETR